MGLKQYRRKRDFNRTPEPAGAERPPAPGRSFVVQKHDASHLHYDFRLELDGVLKSWAVPKGPSLDPVERRLAVHVEDHPLEYGEFEGIIPKGEYGGGTVMVWDRGEWEPEGDPRAGYRRGRLKFRLRGEKLSGGWTLARMAGEQSEEGKNWLLIKRNDEAARPGADLGSERPESTRTGRSLEQIAAEADLVWHSNRPARGKARRQTTPPQPKGPIEIDPSSLNGARRRAQPESLSPQLATLVEAAPEGPGWLHEIKYDGYRLLCFLRRGRARLVTRNDQDWTGRFPAVAEAAARLPGPAILDGEVVVLNAQGAPDFQALQNVMKGVRAGRLVYYAFDLPWCAGYDLRAAPLADRKELLRRLLGAAGAAESAALRFSSHVEGRGPDVHRRACELALEGIVSKRADSRYESRRTRTWVKVKCIKRQEFVVGGWTDPRGSREAFASLLLGTHDEEGKLHYAGKVGTGFDAAELRRLGARLRKLARDRSPFASGPPRAEARGAHWVEPSLVAEVQFAEWTEEGRLRHPSFLGLREDNPAVGTRPERAERSEAEASVAGVRLSNPDRVLWPEQGVTKLDLARYYERVAVPMLRFLKGRPLSLLRCPQGHHRQCFFQKHFREGAPAGLRVVEVPERKGADLMAVVEDVTGLIGLVQLGVLEIHPWGSRIDRIERPDIMIFDLDPGPGVAWPAIVEAARRLRTLLEDLDLVPFLKTSGGKGLHVVVPVVRRTGWDELKEFSRILAERLAREEPERYVATMSKAKRKGKIFIDYLRNARGSTGVAPYSTRARPHAPVSAPIAWDELSARLAPDGFRIGDMPRRVESGIDPWRGLAAARGALTAARRRRAGG